MAKIKLNPLFEGISGKMGDVVFRKSKNGQTYISSCPKKSSAPPSEAQKAQRERLKLANAYATLALADTDLRAIYEEMAAQEGKDAHAMARTDYLRGNDLFSRK